VIRELAASVEMGVAVTDVTSLSWIDSRAPENAALWRIPPGLGPGEHEVLALGLEAPDRLLILDDRAARQSALALGLTYTGPLGVLLEGKRRGRIHSVSARTLEIVRRPVGEAT
jgi:predicted nucleic acid-binding protein